MQRRWETMFFLFVIGALALLYTCVLSVPNERLAIAYRRLSSVAQEPVVLRPGWHFLPPLTPVQWVSTLPYKAHIQARSRTSNNAVIVLTADATYGPDESNLALWVAARPGAAMLTVTAETVLREAMAKMTDDQALRGGDFAEVGTQIALLMQKSYGARLLTFLVRNVEVVIPPEIHIFKDDRTTELFTPPEEPPNATSADCKCPKTSDGRDTGIAGKEAERMEKVGTDSYRSSDRSKRRTERTGSGVR